MKFIRFSKSYCIMITLAVVVPSCDNSIMSQINKLKFRRGRTPSNTTAQYEEVISQHIDINKATNTKQFRWFRNKSTAAELRHSTRQQLLRQSESIQQVSDAQGPLFGPKHLRQQAFYWPSDIDTTMFPGSRLSTRFAGQLGSCYYCGMEPTAEDDVSGKGFVPTYRDCSDEPTGDRMRGQTYTVAKAECFNTLSGARDYATVHNYTRFLTYSPTFTGRCVKRYLDVGDVYTQRSCHNARPDAYRLISEWHRMAIAARGGIDFYSFPHMNLPFISRFGSRRVPRPFVSRRLDRLEAMLVNVSDGCVSSPLASLTPFARGVSLYVRYHVCVCTGDYCNHATHHRLNSPLLGIALHVILKIILT